MTYANTDKFYINGELVEPLSSTAFDVVNPATEKTFATLSLGTSAAVDRAVAAAKEAYKTWGRTTREERVAVMERVLEVYKSLHEDFAVAISTEMGAPISMAREEQAAVGVSHLEAMIDALKRLEFEKTMPNGDTLMRGPIGVCGMITPWNWPINQIVLKVAPALAAGCTMVFKPSEMTPISTILYAEVLDVAGVQPGVFNLVHGMGPDVGAALSKHPDITMMSFTGSYRGGVAVASDSAPFVKRVALELGRKSPNLIFADADLEEAIESGIGYITGNTGQSCDAPSRMLVEASVYEKAVELAKAAAENVEVGNPAEAGGHIGPLASEAHFNKVQSMIQMGIDEGATLITGGTGKPEGFETGYFVKPTVFANVTYEMKIAREEIFGPVVVMIPFADEEEAIAIANDTDFGLSSYVYSGNPERIMRVARRLEAGMVNVNGNYISSGSPFGGYKQSGVGREGGVLGLEEFLEAKAVAAF